jgi:hypothetical protein
MLQRDGMVMVVIKVLVMVMMMMIPMKSSSTAMTMAMIFPLREGISLADFYLSYSFLSLCVFRPAEAAESISDPPLFRFLGTTIYARGRWQKWARVATPLGGTARGWPAPPGGVGPLLLLSPPPSGYFRLLVKYEFLGIFLELLIFRNMVSSQSFFQQNPDSSSKFSNNHQTCKRKGNNISFISKYEIYQ